MSAIKRKQLVKQVSDKLGINEEIVDSIVLGYYEMVRDMLSNLEGPFLYLPNLGVFEGMLGKVFRRTDFLELLTKTPNKKRSLKEYKSYMDNVRDLEKLNEFKIKLLSERDRKFTIRKIRHEKINKSNKEEGNE